MEDSAVRRARLAVVEGELSRLRAQHEIAMSAFRFDAASATQQRIAALEDERRALADALPPSAAEPPTGVIPVLARRRRRPGHHRPATK